jgi:hypothetical protein
MIDDNHFLEDGYERAYSANEPVVRAEVELEFADALSKASASERERIRKEIESVIAKRVDELAPPDALY